MWNSDTFGFFFKIATACSTVVLPGVMPCQHGARQGTPRNQLYDGSSKAIVGVGSIVCTYFACDVVRIVGVMAKLVKLSSAVMAVGNKAISLIVSGMGVAMLAGMISEVRGVVT